MIRSVIGTTNCFGCGVCAAVCKHNSITIGLNKDGFYEPQVRDLSSCTNCGLCKLVCSFDPNDVIGGKPVASFGAWSNNEDVRRICSSGGIAFEISRHLISQGFKVCGVRYNADLGRAEHYIANTLEETLEMCGSKYIQSFTLDAFKKINLKEKYLVVGTPCQIDSFRRYIKLFKCEDNFVLMDFFCHSVPTMNAWRFYIDNVKKRFGEIKSVAWRNKERGWHDSWAVSSGKEQPHYHLDLQQSHQLSISEKKHFYVSNKTDGDLFYRLFLNDYCSNDACSKSCRFKYDKSSADIRIGDFWGKTYNADEKGVSAVAAFTNRGQKILNELENCTFQEFSFETIAEGQMKRNITHSVVRPIMMKVLSHNKPSVAIVNSLVFCDRVIRRIKAIVSK